MGRVGHDAIDVRLPDDALTVRLRTFLLRYDSMYQAHDQAAYLITRHRGRARRGGLGPQVTTPAGPAAARARAIARRVRRVGAGGRVDREGLRRIARRRRAGPRGGLRLGARRVCRRALRRVPRAPRGRQGRPGRAAAAPRGARGPGISEKEEEGAPGKEPDEEGRVCAGAVEFFFCVLLSGRGLGCTEVASRALWRTCPRTIYEDLTSATRGRGLGAKQTTSALRKAWPDARGRRLAVASGPRPAGWSRLVSNRRL